MVRGCYTVKYKPIDRRDIEQFSGSRLTYPFHFALHTDAISTNSFKWSIDDKVSRIGCELWMNKVESNKQASFETWDDKKEKNPNP